MTQRRLPIGTIRADPEVLRREVGRERERINRDNRWRTDPPREVVVSTSVTIDRNDRIVLVDDDTAVGIVTVTVGDTPDDGQTHTVKKLGTTGNVNVSGNGKNIDGSATLSLTTQYQVATILYSAEKDEWFVVSNG